MKLTVRTRLSISFALLFTVLIAVFSGVIYYLMASNLERELAEDATHGMNEVLLALANGPWESRLAEMAEESREFKINIKVLDSRGKILFLTEGVHPSDWPVDEGLLAGARTKSVRSDEEINGVPHLVLTRSFTPAGKRVHFLQVAKSKADVNRIRNQLIFCVNVGTPLILLIAFIAGRFFAKRALEPVETIRFRAETITSDNLHDRLRYDGPPDELARLTETLNDLLDRVERAVDNIKRFVADASHELRIPLTGLLGTVEVALRQDRSQEEYKKTLETIHDESEQLRRLVVDLLSLAEADSDGMKLEKKEVRVGPFLEEIFKEAERLASEKNVTLRRDRFPGGTAVFDETRVRQLLLNLLENSVRYNKPGGDVRLSGRLDSRALIVSVKDTGIGIPKDDQAGIFDRFYRVDKARSREAGGTGLGLAIARSIAEAHGGTLTVRSALNEGSEFILILPLS